MSVIFFSLSLLFNRYIYLRIVVDSNEKMRANSTSKFDNDTVSEERYCPLFYHTRGSSMKIS